MWADQPSSAKEEYLLTKIKQTKSSKKGKT